MWVRGLKRLGNISSGRNSDVTPRVGAWIETQLCVVWEYLKTLVAPRVGAWIETRQYDSGVSGFPRVAPRVGAWIETNTLIFT